MPQPDTDVVRCRQITYTFFTRKMGSKFTILESSAGPYQQKKAALINDVVRRLLHI